MMTAQEYLADLERRFDSGDPLGAYLLWRTNRDERFETGLSADERRRLRSTLHLVLQMAAELGWDQAMTVESGAKQRTI